MITTFVWMPWPSDVGYGIKFVERLFFNTALELSGGDPSRIHYAYADIAGGPSGGLPEGFANVTALRIHDHSPSAHQALARHLDAIKADLVITFDVQPVHPSFRVMRQHGVSTIISYWGAPISSPMPAWKLAIKRAELRLSRSKADGLVFESQAMADLAVSGRGVPEHMIDIVPIGVDIDRFRPAPSDYVYTTFGFPRDRRVIVYSGHCDERKGMPTLIAGAIDLLARRKRPDVCFLICGNRSKEESRPFEAMYAGMGIDNLIHFAGYRSDLLEIFQSAYCGLIPTTGWDSFTTSSVEMAATGLPVVASRLQGLAEAVLDRETGLLFEPGNATALADTIETLLDHPEQAREYGAAGRRRCERELNLKRQRERFVTAVRRHLPVQRARQAV